MASEVEELRCVIVDDNPVFIEVATRLLERGGISIIGAASTIAEAVRRVEELRLMSPSSTWIWAAKAVFISP